MIPPDNRMLSQMGPGGQLQLPPGMNPQMLQQLMAMQQGVGPGFQPPGGLESMRPDQGGYGGGGMPMPKPQLSMPPGMPPGANGRVAMQKPMLVPQQAPRSGMPTVGPRLPPGAGAWKNPVTGQMMNQTPFTSGKMPPPPGMPETGGVMPGGVGATPPQDPGMTAGPANDVPATTRPMEPAGGTAFAPVGLPGKGKPGGSAPFNPEKEAKPQWQPSRPGLAGAMTSRFTRPKTR